MLSKYRKMWTVIFVLSCLSLCTGTVYAYSDGNGTPPEPYLIATVSDWQQLMATSADWNKYFLMTADIDLQGVSLTPVGNTTTNWTGVFDGDGFVIYNATMSGSTNVALFGRTSATGKISNLGLENVNIVGGSYVGALVGRHYGTIINCDITGSVTGSSNYVGGFAGGNYGFIIDCFSTAAIKGSGYVGGLAGSNSSAASDVNTSYSTGSAIGTGNYIGGLVGYNYGDIVSSYAKGDANGISYVGGLAGYISSGTVSTCYSIGKVIGTSNTGGLIGYRSSGTVDVNSFWDVNTSGKLTSAGGTGKTTAEMQNINTYLNGLWNFTTPIWEICDGTNYPKFAWQEPLLGDFNCPDGVGFADLAFLVQRWLRTDCASTNNCDGADLNIDGKVNFSDFSLFAENWMEK